LSLSEGGLFWRLSRWLEREGGKVKFNVLPRLIIPWLLMFLLIIAAQVVIGVRFNFDFRTSPYFMWSIVSGLIVCGYFNFRTTTASGIWIAHSFQDSSRSRAANGILTIVVSLALMFLVYWTGKLAWAPLYWSGIVVPLFFTVGIVIVVWSLVAPILQWCSMIACTRLAIMIFTLPVFLIFPVSSVFIGQIVLSAYLASQPLSVLVAGVSKVEKAGSSKNIVGSSPFAAPTEEKAKTFKAIAERKRQCTNVESRQIQVALLPNSADEVLYWAIRAISCAQLKSVIGLGRLIEIISKNGNPMIRSAAILAMNNFRDADVKPLGYLLFKRLNDKESPEVVVAAANVLFKLGDTESRITLKKLKDLLNHPRHYQTAAQTLIALTHNESFVFDYIGSHLVNPGEAQARAIGLICLLSEPTRVQIEPRVSSIVAAIKTGMSDDPAIEALNCLKNKGIETIRQELLKPAVISKNMAATALSQMEIKHSAVALQTISDCVNDKDPKVRTVCSQGLGRIGAAALPRIVDLLKSGNSQKIESGVQALRYFDDISARQNLLKVRAENSGWNASQRKLGIAKAIDTALGNVKEYR
jgi:HEAT repeat protein